MRLAVVVALARESFTLHYQPQMDMATARIVGVEALLRWPSGDQSYRRPDQFIPVAEATGLIVKIGVWVLKQACGDLARLRRAGLDWGF